MPSFNCKHGTCAAILPTRGYCPAHADRAQDDAAAYDRHKRDARSKVFYNSTVWRAARSAKLARDPMCERCGRELATTVHHVREVADVRDVAPELLTAYDNLESTCTPCHTRGHKRKEQP